MFGMRAAAPQRPKTEGEKPFWISYADLMTALMILFLIVMVASLAMMTKRIADAEQGEKARAADISKLCNQLKIRARNLDIVVDCRENRINFGEAGRFGYNDYKLGPAGQQALRNVVPLVIEAANSEEGRKWFKQVLIEGFTDTDGSYLYNLHLSLQRSEWVMCAILDDRYSVVTGLDQDQKRQVRDLFLAGGVSFNNAKDSKEASRRVELRMQFYGLKDRTNATATTRPIVFDGTAPEKCLLQ
ncbi:type I Zorya anti-phage system protein ZorB1 [Herbaspirillum sp. SJZ107]|uniref:type I Zorya anti-phage system protein ZorB1 n=1 Tax=Herbaspirillum sp. SJZ107 TaxID=2572881 RepID=UPI0011501B4C|nr:type I Zorya anti-phage system protein ZorB1 [Herbaspirillum sp. SJZ107]TQK03441.1 outer membrane protein OmpA-like peptidoglycan-associated protein [Herbaspirillum sp. SJZ107]